jgi:hypothetical protein
VVGLEQGNGVLLCRLGLVSGGSFGGCHKESFVACKVDVRSTHEQSDQNDDRDGDSKKEKQQ